MLKRILICLLALLIWQLPADAEEDAYQKTMNALYRLVLRTEEGDQPLGSGVLFLQQDVLLTAAGCCREGDIVAIGADGEHAVAEYDLSASRDVAMMRLATPSAMTPLEMSDYDSPALPCLFGADNMHNMGVMNLFQVLQDVYRDRSAVVLSAEEGLLPGAVMVDEQGDVMGLVVAQKAEGLGMYIAQEASGIYAAVTGSDAQEAFLPLATTWSDGWLTISWEDQPRDDGVYVLTISGETNNYYTSYEVQPEERSIALAVPPGSSYLFQVQWAPTREEAQAPVWSAMSRFTAPLQPFTDYGFRQECYLAGAPAGTAVEGLLPEMTAVTAQSLSDPLTDLYLQVINTYDVAEEITLPMTVSLTAPDGQFYFEESGYLFSPEYETNDVFALPVEVLFADYSRFSGGSFQPGMYTLSYAIGGCAAGEYSFILQENAAPAEETSGFVPGMTAAAENGCITVAWDGSRLPEGAKVNVYFLYDGNSYYTYYSMTDGAQSTEIAAVPCRRVMVWGVWSTEGEPPHITPESEAQYLLVEAAAQEPFTRNGFVNLHCSIVPSSDPQAAEKGVPLPPAELTRELLSDPETYLYFQTEDTYQAENMTDGHALALALFTPDGMVFVERGAYVFDPALGSSDQWLLDISALFGDWRTMNGDQPWPAGEYTLLYLIEGRLAGQFVFTLE